MNSEGKMARLVLFLKFKGIKMSIYCKPVQHQAGVKSWLNIDWDWESMNVYNGHLWQHEDKNNSWEIKVL